VVGDEIDHGPSRVGAPGAGTYVTWPRRVGRTDRIGRGVVTVVASRPEADIVCGLLRSAGIECAYRDIEAIESSLEDLTPCIRVPPFVARPRGRA
jgi:hypothetical protein